MLHALARDGAELSARADIRLAIEPEQAKQSSDFHRLKYVLRCMSCDYADDILLRLYIDAVPGAGNHGRSTGVHWSQRLCAKDFQDNKGGLRGFKKL